MAKRISILYCGQASIFVPSLPIGCSVLESTHSTLERYEDKTGVDSGYELLDAQKQANLLVLLASVGRYILMGLQLLFTVPLIFIIFPDGRVGLSSARLYLNPIRGILSVSLTTSLNCLPLL